MSLDHQHLLAPHLTTPPSLRARRAAGVLAVLGAGVMVGGAVLHTAFGADLFALTQGMTETATTDLEAVAAHRPALVAGTWLWLLGVPAMCAAGTLTVRGSSGPAATVARWAFAAGTGAALTYFCLMLGIVEVLAPAHAAGEDVLTVTLAIGWAAGTADWLATFLILGIGYVGVVVSGRGRWAPRWLVGLAGLTAVVGVASLLAQGSMVGMLLVACGLSMVVATGVVTLRSRV